LGISPSTIIICTWLKIIHY